MMWVDSFRNGFGLALVKSCKNGYDTNTKKILIFWCSTPLAPCFILRNVNVDIVNEVKVEQACEVFL
jgi:hypothetical protein